MTDIYCEFLNLLMGGDPEKLDRFALRQNKKEAGRQICRLREKLNLSYLDFAEILALNDPDDVEDLELGNFDESPIDKLRQVYGAFLARKDVLPQVTISELSERGETPFSSKGSSRLLPSTFVGMACKTRKTQDA